MRQIQSTLEINRGEGGGRGNFLRIRFRFMQVMDDTLVALVAFILRT
jgi:hypothetical protein